VVDVVERLSEVYKDRANGLPLINSSVPVVRYVD